MHGHEDHIQLTMWRYLLIPALFAYSLDVHCNEKYLNISFNHFMCQPKNESCIFHRQERSKERVLIKTHNELRNVINSYNGIPHSTNMLVMQWDVELYQIARHQVRRCVEHSNCTECYQTGETHVEQNFDVRTYTNGSKEHNNGPNGRFKQVVQDWANEIESVDLETIKNFTVLNTSPKNWANIFRASTYKVGCDSINYMIDNVTYKEIYVCNYTPATFTEGEEIFKIGDKACSQCPSGMSCDIQFKNLCSPTQTTTSTTGSVTTVSESTIQTKTTKNAGKEIENPISEILWECNFSIGMEQQCEAEQQCYPKWETFCLLDYCYKEINLEKEKSSLLFLTPIFVKNEACLKFYYRKGQEFLRSNGKSTLIAVAIWNNGNDYEMIIINDDAEHWTLVRLNIPLINQNIQIGLTVRKIPYTPGEVIAVKNLVITSGSCE